MRPPSDRRQMSQSAASTTDGTPTSLPMKAWPVYHSAKPVGGVSVTCASPSIAVERCALTSIASASNAVPILSVSSG